MEFSEGTRTFGVRFYEDEDKAESYQFVFNTTENRYVFEKKPNWPWPANQNIGLERPIDLIPGKKYNIRMIVDDTIATIYVDGVALNARDKSQKGSFLGYIKQIHNFIKKDIGYHKRCGISFKSYDTLFMDFA